MPKKNVQPALRNKQNPHVNPNAVVHVYSAEYTLIVFALHTLSYIKAVEGNINQITMKVLYACQERKEMQQIQKKV